MEGEIYILPVGFDNFEVDSLDNYNFLCEMMGALAVSVAGDYPDKDLLLVYPIEDEG